MPNFMLLKEGKILAALLLIFVLAGCGEKKEKVVTIPEATFAITEGVANWSGELKDRLQAVSSAHRIIFLTKEGAITGNVVWARQEAQGKTLRAGNLMGGGFFAFSFGEVFGGWIMREEPPLTYRLEGPINAVTTTFSRAAEKIEP